MQNHIQNGHAITASALTAGISPGEGLIIGNIFGIAAYTAAGGNPPELATG